MSRAMPRLRHGKLIDGEADVNRAGGWSRKRIVRMDERFVAAVRQAHPAAETGEGQQGLPNHNTGHKERPRRRLVMTPPDAMCD
jgi:hypothetical protein